MNIDSFDTVLPELPEPMPFTCDDVETEGLLRAYAVLGSQEDTEDGEEFAGLYGAVPSPPPVTLPLYRMTAAVMLKAMEDLGWYDGSEEEPHPPNSRRYYGWTAWAWVFEKVDGAPLPFPLACQILGIDRRIVREKAAAIISEKTPPP